MSRLFRFTRPGSARPRGPRGAAPAAFVLGILCAAGYLGSVILAPAPGRIVFDGLVPLPPYRWVHPPAGRAGDNRAPSVGRGVVVLGPPSRAAEVSTDDDQALVTFPQGAAGARAGETSVMVTLTPLDPAAVAQPPAGLTYDGNAYRVAASYASSGAPAILSGTVTVVLRYPVHATTLLRFADGAWTQLTPQVFTGSQQVLANTDRLGTFVAAAPNR